MAISPGGEYLTALSSRLAHDGPAAIRHSADFHIQLQAISGNYLEETKLEGVRQGDEYPVPRLHAPALHHAAEGI
ncbi:hypothetical protein FK513_29380, partial [Klebsiella pneumoniae]|nr:hypothetical protein [Klebsiella pneumoniae]